ncbi:MAG: DinB family protein [Anaerolineaceae bacterium]|nr:DinB family protein [Anaerolineaceae bacterium]
MDRDGLLALFRYNAYANRLLLDQAGRLSEAELDCPASPSYDSVRRLLLHMFRSERFFLDRCTGAGPGATDFATLADLRPAWEALAEEAQAYLTGLEAATLDEMRSMTVAGQTLRFPVWQMLTQACVHATHHRGELSVVMTALGHPLPTLDIILQFAGESGQPWPQG